MQGYSFPNYAKIDIPMLWSTYHWERPYMSLKSDANSDVNYHKYPFLQTAINSGFQMQRLAQRRSATRGDNFFMSSTVLDSFLQIIYEGIADRPCMFAALTMQNVEGWADDAYVLMNSPRHLIQCHSDISLAQKMIQGQLWSGGDGLGICLGFDSSYLEKDSATDTIYYDLLTHSGRIGHALVLKALSHHLGTRMTPAVHEDTGQELFRLSPEQDIIYYLRVCYETPDPRR